MVDIDKLLELEASAAQAPWSGQMSYPECPELWFFKCPGTGGQAFSYAGVDPNEAKLICEMRNSIKELCTELKAAREIVRCLDTADYSALALAITTYGRVVNDRP